YDTGQWTLDFAGVAIENGGSITASYTYVIPGTDATDAGTGTTDPSASGVTGAFITSFTVEHYGNVIRIIDNNGASYEGSFGDIHSTGGVNQDNTGIILPQVGDEIIGSFEVHGTSAAGY